MLLGLLATLPALVDLVSCRRNLNRHGQNAYLANLDTGTGYIGLTFFLATICS